MRFPAAYFGVIATRRIAAPASILSGEKLMDGKRPSAEAECRKLLVPRYPDNTNAAFLDFRFAQLG